MILSLGSQYNQSYLRMDILIEETRIRGQQRAADCRPTIDSPIDGE